MARPKRTDIETLRSRMRTVALMNELAQRVGAANPNQFARWFDEQAGASTEESGKWRHNFNGNRPLSAQQLNWLSQLPEAPDARARYQEGPAGLWRAMWCPPAELWHACRTRQAGSTIALDAPSWLQNTGDEANEGQDRCLDEMLREFEGELLLAEAYGEPLRLSHLTEAISLYRLHQHISSIARTSLDGSGAYRCVRMCTDNSAVHGELDRLGVYELVVSELAATESAHLAESPAYRASLPVAEEDLDLYLMCPDILIREEQRWAALNFDWAP